jgi:hypothetical protein
VKYDADALHADLARANLLRVRGDFAAAEKLCVEVLEKHPESAAAHTLLGNIAFSQDRADQAVEHFEIAQSLDPEAPDIPRKLKDARELKKNREAASSVEQLGLTPRRQLPWSTIAFATFAVGCLVTAAVLGFRSPPPGKTVVIRQVAAPIEATADTLATPPAVVAAKAKVENDSPPPPDDADAPTPETVAPAPVATPPLAAIEDRSMFQLVQDRSLVGSHLQSVTQDPRTKLVVLTYAVSAGDDARKLGADLAKTTLDQSTDTQIVTLRAVKEGRLIYMADIPRTRYADTLADAWKQSNPGADAWIPYAVTNEWPSRSPDALETSQKDTGSKTP